jgi:diguanylate cyclase (GGDEF)-like protein
MPEPFSADKYLIKGDWGGSLGLWRSICEERAMQEDLKNRLGRCPTLPSPPGIVVSLLQLGEDPEVTAQGLARLIAKDPALTTQVLRIVNSPLFGIRREVTSLQQAVAFLGISGVRTVSLGFSLGRGVLRKAWREIHNETSWKRAVVAAAVARDMAVLLHIAQKEEVFLGALLQDIGILALREVLGGEYEELVLANGSRHTALVECERERLGCDHSEVGAWLLEQWGLPRLFQVLVRASHGESLEEVEPECRPLALCVSVSGVVADLWLHPGDPESAAATLSETARRLMVDEEELQTTLSGTAKSLPELLRLFDLDFRSVDFEGMLERARQHACSVSLQSLVQAREQEGAVVTLSAEVVRLRKMSERDPLTGAYSRLFFEEVLDDNFRQVSRANHSLSLCFCDLDNFKEVNDRLGHLEGDAMLKMTARSISNQLRKGDFVSRYGGDEFVVLLLDCPADVTAMVCERIRKALRAELTRYLEAAKLSMTVSIGYAVQVGSEPYSSPRELVNAADQALFEAKRQGRNRTLSAGACETGGAADPRDARAG